MNNVWDQSSGRDLFQSRRSALTEHEKTPNAEHLIRHIVVRAPELIPKDILDEGLLTPGDQRDIALDHITRTSDVVFQLRILKRA